MSKDWRPRQGEPVVPGGRQEDGGCNLDDQTLESIVEVGGLGTTVHGAGTAAQASGRSVGVDAAWVWTGAWTGPGLGSVLRAEWDPLTRLRPFPLPEHHESGWSESGLKAAAAAASHTQVLPD